MAAPQPSYDYKSLMALASVDSSERVDELAKFSSDGKCFTPRKSSRITQNYTMTNLQHDMKPIATSTRSSKELEKIYSDCWKVCSRMPGLSNK